MINDIHIQKITSFLENQMSKNLTEIVIFKNDIGSYELFNRYIITVADNFYEVSYKNGSIIKKFYNLKNAVAWCIFDKRNKFNKTQRLEDLDRMIGSAEFNMIVHKKIMSSTKDIDTKLINLAKYNEEKLRKKLMTSELVSYIQESKNYQNSQFANLSQIK